MEKNLISRAKKWLRPHELYETAKEINAGEFWIMG